ncbi:protein-disulfide reductase DsbD [Acidocella sp.]|uniref:protein-disulfide reductase DsbD family protein n=1 Tax=Acidocella sp. TaxID=50710 RepID=UPI002638FCFD|nr:thioredoxin family protein [Acidocella sp.]MDD2794246.1 protein-disulfide reductase DsbD family protein [Acidocella sp.]
MRALLLLFLLLPGLAFGATSNVFTSPRDSVRLISAANTGPDVPLALQFQLAPGWHIYWSNPGDAGFPPRIIAAAPANFGQLSFPPPELFHQGPVTAYVLSGKVLLPFMAHNAGSSVTAAASWLVCSDICIPEHASFTLPLPGGPSAEAALFTGPKIIASPFPATIAPDGTLTLTGPTAAQVAAAHFFPAAPGMLENGAPQRLAFTASGLTLGLTLAPGHKPLTGLLELTDPSGATQSLTLAPAPGAAPAHPPYLLLAFLGGLILNFMPCVFPILAMKAVLISRLGGVDTKIRHEAFGYTFGVLATMLAMGATLLALRALGAAAGWGFQFQSPIFVALIAWVIFALTLNLAGLFALSAPAALGRLPVQHSISTGALAVIVATPCSAPFMGTAVAAALAAPPFMALGIFLALGLGLAAPFLLLASIPRLAHLIPRPGAWMLWLQRALALPMAATFAWLAWVLFHQTGLPGLLLLLLGAAILAAALTRKPLRPLALALLLLLPLLRTQAAAPALTLPGALPYTAARLAQLRAAKTPVFIDLTAAWCVTCLVNEATTLKNPGVEAAFAATRTALLAGDWTNKNPAITALLAANHRDGVPLYLYYAPGASTPLILPQILTAAAVRAALRGSR